MTMAVGCKEEDRVGVGNADADLLPTMMTRDVETLVSDSGITKFKITTPVWYVYDEIEKPYWKFPEGLWLEKYDPQLNIEATITADSAIYFKQSQLWRLDGHVDIANTDGKRFLTSQLFWDQRHHKLYSDSFIHIEQPNQILEGYGFDSNEQLTRYNLRSVSGIFPTSAFQPSDGPKGQAEETTEETNQAEDSQTPAASTPQSAPAPSPEPARATADPAASDKPSNSTTPLQLKKANQ